jgi:AcrR family transcriptional regulator
VGVKASPASADRRSRRLASGRLERGRPVHSRRVSQTPTRERSPAAGRTRIAEAALQLFQSQGYRDTTIDQIAAAARVARRTVFYHFPTKEAVLLDHLVVRRKVTLQRLRDRPITEPPLASLHAAFRELAEQGYDRRLITQIRAIAATDPQVAMEHFSIVSREFEKDLVATLQDRAGPARPQLELNALTKMVLGWFTTAAHAYLTEGRPSLLTCYDEVVATCIQASTQGL